VSAGTAPPGAERAAAGWTRGLRARVVSGLFMAAIALPALFTGPTVFGIFVCAGVVVLAWEWTRLCGEGRFGLTGLVEAAAALAAAVAANRGLEGLALAAVIAGTAAVYATARGGARAHPFWLAAGPVYIGLPAIALIWLRGHGVDGERVILWLMLSVWATDIGAFFAGRLIGGPRIAPRLSPNKTWAGLAGGMASSALVGLAVARVDSLAPSAAALTAAGALLAVVAQAGDFAESAVKRRFGAKDSSALIPGHGGLFDRVDGLIAAACALALFQWATASAVLAWR
jgi:phosphatidate cytidylyltransferase